MTSKVTVDPQAHRLCVMESGAGEMREHILEQGTAPREFYVWEKKFLTIWEPALTASAEFVRGAAACREMMARFVEQGGDTVTAGSIRANWNPAWGPEPPA